MSRDYQGTSLDNLLITSNGFSVFTKVRKDGAKASFRVMLKYFEINKTFMYSNLFRYYIVIMLIIIIILFVSHNQ